NEQGRIYVGGLYVSTVKGFRSGYAFAPDKIKLDRDRGMVDGFDLAWATSNLWTGVANSRAVELMNEEAPDVRYVENQANVTSALVVKQAEYFHQKHGYDAIPVSNQEEIEQATNAGMRWVLVPKTVKAVLRLVKSWFIPSTDSPVERLRKFQKNYAWQLDSEAKQELEAIIESMDLKTKVEVSQLGR